MNKPLLVFDMDGVLVDVTESYRETIARTVERFTGHPITREKIMAGLASKRASLTSGRQA